MSKAKLSKKHMHLTPKFQLIRVAPGTLGGKIKAGSKGPFLESRDYFSGQKSYLIFAVVAIKIKVSIIFKMIQ